MFTYTDGDGDPEKTKFIDKTTHKDILRNRIKDVELSDIELAEIHRVYERVHQGCGQRIR